MTLHALKLISGVTSAPERRRMWPMTYVLALLGLTLAFAQLAFACAASEMPSAGVAYHSLYQWDSLWYADIAATGYRGRVPPGPLDRDRHNVAFFPGLPAVARAVMLVGGLPAPTAVLVAAQLACWAFWAYLLLLLRRWRVPPDGVAACALLLFAHPCAFYLVAGYSESLFLAALLGYLYWAGCPGRAAWGMAAAHGVVLTATRIVGLPLIVLPLATAVVSGRGRAGTVGGAVALAGVAALGGVAFFGYCWWAFGHWDLYLQTQRSGWGIVPDYLAVVRPASYQTPWPAPGPDGPVDPRALSRLAVPLTLGLLAAAVGLEGWAAWRGPGGGWRERVPLHLAAWCLFYVPVCGLAAVGMNSMVRYAFPAHVLTALAAAHLLARQPMPLAARVVGFGLVLVTAAGGLWLQGELVFLFTHDRWVA